MTLEDFGRPQSVVEEQGNWVLMLQLQDLRVDQVKESCIRVNIRELNR